MNPLIAIIVTGIAMFAAHILVILLFREKPAPKPKPVAAEAAAPAVRAPSLADRVVPRTKDDMSPLMGRRGWMGLAWGAFTASTAGCLAATGRFMFPNVLNEPPQQFTIGFPDEYGEGVDERWKDRFGVWVVRTPFDDYHEVGRFLRPARYLHASWVHAELVVGGEQVQVPVPRQRIPSDRHQLRGAGAAAARAGADRTGGRRTDPGRQGAEVPGGAGAVDRPGGVSRCLGAPPTTHRKRTNEPWPRRRQLNRRKARSCASGTG